MNILLISFLVSFVWLILWAIWFMWFSTFTPASIRAMTRKQVAFIMVLGGPLFVIICFLYFFYGWLGRK